MLQALSEIEEENLAEGAVFSERVATTIRLLKLPLNADNIAQVNKIVCLTGYLRKQLHE